MTSLLARAVNVHHSNGLMNVIDLAEQMSVPVNAEDKGNRTFSCARRSVWDYLQ